MRQGRSFLMSANASGQMAVCFTVRLYPDWLICLSVEVIYLVCEQAKLFGAIQAENICWTKLVEVKAKKCSFIIILNCGFTIPGYLLLLLLLSFLSVIIDIVLHRGVLLI